MVAVVLPTFTADLLSEQNTIDSLAGAESALIVSRWLPKRYSEGEETAYNNCGVSIAWAIGSYNNHYGWRIWLNDPFAGACSRHLRTTFDQSLCHSRAGSSQVHFAIFIFECGGITAGRPALRRRTAPFFSAIRAEVLLKNQVFHLFSLPDFGSLTGAGVSNHLLEAGRLEAHGRSGILRIKIDINHRQDFRGEAEGQRQRKPEFIRLLEGRKP